MQTPTETKGTQSSPRFGPYVDYYAQNTLYLSTQHLTDEDITALIPFLNANPRLKSLYLSDCRMNDALFMKLVEGIRTVSTIFLMCNNVTRRSFKALEKHKSIMHVKADHSNNLTLADLRRLNEILAENAAFNAAQKIYLDAVNSCLNVYLPDVVSKLILEHTTGELPLESVPKTEGIQVADPSQQSQTLFSSQDVLFPLPKPGKEIKSTSSANPCSIM